ncbi:MAG TPA: hypothetical protein PLP02_03495 [Bacillota bacterium]|nr:hypothetical protein [Bacillota bacterium]HPF42549.1 hypothetical protein [Bacillota bacterium]HPJ86007.1 hypothetical protein [Bacillota bacterium]
MCDTLYRKTGTSAFFAKNSDRSPNEPNLTVFVEAKPGDPLNRKKCTYVEIDENPDTFAMILVKPSWMWGAEMGINSQGVAIGNEAVFTKNRDKKTERLTGMDLLRLGLEEGDTARHALDVIIGYLEKYGQGGNCGFDKPFYYDNSFLIADSREAFILEIVGKKHIEWQLDASGNISNRLSVMNETAAAFFKRNTEPVFTCFSGSFNREKTLREAHITGIKDVIKAMQMHPAGLTTKTLFRRGTLKSPCMHYSTLGDHTTSSMIVEWKGDKITIWLTGRSTPCLAIYLPVIFDRPGIPVFKSEKESLDFWLEREYLSRAVFSGLVIERDYKIQTNAIEEKLIQMAAGLGDDLSFEEIGAFNNYVLEMEAGFVKEYANIIHKVQSDPSVLTGRWKKKTLTLGKNVFLASLEERRNTR